MAKNWECSKVKGKKYVQRCRWVGDGERKARLVKTDKGTKKAYNKVYRKWKKTHKVGTGPARAGYRCRRTTVASCK